jgi:hypothetical protein
MDTSNAGSTGKCSVAIKDGLLMMQRLRFKGTKGGKLVIDKKDKKKVEKVIAKQMKKPADAKRVLWFLK